jgi:hypothetical protein
MYYDDVSPKKLLQRAVRSGHNHRGIRRYFATAAAKKTGPFKHCPPMGTFAETQPNVLPFRLLRDLTQRCPLYRVGVLEW